MGASCREQDGSNFVELGWNFVELAGTSSNFVEFGWNFVELRRASLKWMRRTQGPMGPMSLIGNMLP